MPAHGEVSVTTADRPLDEERRRLERWARAFERVVGWAPRFEPLCEGPPAGWDSSWGEPFALTFEPRLDPIEMLGGTGHFAHRDVLATHLRRMGFGWSTDGRVLTAPSPRSFNFLADLTLGASTGYRVAVIERDARHLALGPWMLAYLSGRVPVQLASDAFYERLLANRAAPHDLHFHFSSFAHDLTVHALNYQLVPRPAITALTDRVVSALTDRYASWEHPDAPGPLTLTTFFDNDLNRYCYAVWARSEDVSDFARLFLEHLPQLTACLDLRIDETRRGLGDVASADTADLPPLQPWEFDLLPAAAPPPTPAPTPDPATAAALRLDLAWVLVRARQLPVALPTFQLTLRDVTVDQQGLELLVGHEAPIAALRLEQRSDDTGVTSSVRTLHPSAQRHALALARMAERLERALTRERWREAAKIADALLAHEGEAPRSSRSAPKAR